MAGCWCQSRTSKPAHLLMPSHGLGAHGSQLDTAPSVIQGLIWPLFRSASSLPGPEIGPGDSETKKKCPCPWGVHVLHVQSCLCKVIMPTPPVPIKLAFRPRGRALPRSLTQFHLIRFAPIGQSAKIILDLASVMPCPSSRSRLHVIRECDKPACYVFITVWDNTVQLQAKDRAWRH